MRILFLGSSRFSTLVLKRMLEKKLDVVYVITSPDKECGRGHKLQANEVKVFAQQNNIKVLCSAKIANDLEEIKKINYDVAIVASFGQILPIEFLEHKLCLNVHPSKLPLYRGASPMQSAILNGDKNTAVSIMKIAEKLDSGDIALQKDVSILGNEMYSELEERLAIVGADMIEEAIELLKNGKLNFVKQDESKATYVKKFEKQDGLLDFSKTADEIINKVRALAETLGTYIYLKSNKIKIFKVQKYEKEVKNCKVNQVLNEKKNFVIACCDGAVEILSCLSSSGKRMTGVDFINGFHPQGEFVNELG